MHRTLNQSSLKTGDLCKSDVKLHNKTRQSFSHLTTLYICIALTEATKSDGSIFQKDRFYSKEKKGKNAISTLRRRFVWEQVIWPLFLDSNRPYFTLDQYHKKRDRVCDLNGISHNRLSGGFISLVYRGVLQRESAYYSLNYRLVPYLRNKVVLEYGIAL